MVAQSTAKERTRQMIREEELVAGLRDRVKSLDRDQSYYYWKDLVVWYKGDYLRYRLLTDSPTWIYFGAILGFVLLTNYAPQSKTLSQFMFILIFCVPFGIEYAQQYVMAPKILGKKVAHIILAVCGSGKLYEIRDEIVKEVTLAYKADPKLPKKARNRGGLQITFKNHWQVEGKIFKRLTVFGPLKYMQSVSSLAFNHRMRTDIFGVDLHANVFLMWLKTDVRRWSESTEQFACASLATKETGSELKIVEPSLVISQEGQVVDCPHCGLPVTHSEDFILDRYAALVHKANAGAERVRVYYLEDMIGSITESDFKDMEDSDWRDDYYKTKFKYKLRVPQLPLAYWIVIFVLGVALAMALFPSFRATMQEYWDAIKTRLGMGGGGET